MDEAGEKKQEIRDTIERKLAGLSENEKAEKIRSIENRLFEFANFLESRVVLLYLNKGCEVNTLGIIRRSYDYSKIVVLPGFELSRHRTKLYKVDNFNIDLKDEGPRRVPEPNPEKCKQVPVDSIDIAIVPAVCLDEKGGRIGSGDGYYDRLIPRLSITTRKVALAFEEQVLPQVPMESHDKYVDIIITENRIIYKI